MEVKLPSCHQEVFGGQKLFYEMFLMYAHVFSLLSVSYYLRLPESLPERQEAAKTWASDVVWFLCQAR